MNDGYDNDLWYEAKAVLSELTAELYQLENCVRTGSDMDKVNSLRELIEKLTDELNGIDSIVGDKK